MAEADRKSADDAAPPAPPVPKAGGMSKMVVAVLLVGVLVLGGGAYFAGRMTAAHDESAETAVDAAVEPPAAKGGKPGKAGKAGAKNKGKSSKAAPQVPIYWALDPPFVVNYQDNQVLRYLQVGVQVMAYDTETIELLKANEPQVRNALLMLFSEQQYENLITREGKDALRESALAELRKIVDEQSGKPGPQSVYFTSFVMQ